MVAEDFTVPLRVALALDFIIRSDLWKVGSLLTLFHQERTVYVPKIKPSSILWTTRYNDVFLLVSVNDTRYRI